MFRKVTCIFLLLFMGIPAQAGLVLLTDFDGTLIKDRQSSFKGYYFLKRIEQLHTIAQYDSSYDNFIQEFPVSVEEYIELEARLAKGNGQIKSLEPVRLNPDPVTNGILQPEMVGNQRPDFITPGLYYLNEEIAFLRYRHSPIKNYLLEDFQLAKKRQKINKKSFYGLTYGIFSWLMENPSSGEIAITTARSQNHKDFLEAFHFLLGQNDLKRVDKNFRVYLGHGIKSRKFGKNLVDRKIESLRLETEGISMKKLRPEDLVLHIDQDKALLGEKELRHIVLVSEDSYEFSTAFVEAMEILSKSPEYRKKIKFVFLFSGDNKYVQDSKFLKNYRGVVFDGKGFTRPLIEEELKEIHLSRQAARNFEVNYIQNSKKSKVKHKANKKKMNSEEKRKKTQRERDNKKNNTSDKCQHSFGGKK